MNSEDKRLKYGALRNNTLVDDEELPMPPSYKEATDGRNNLQTSKVVALTGFILIQIFLIGSIIHQLYNESTQYSIAPEQLHLSLGKNDTEYYISWSTSLPANCQLIWHRNGSKLTKSVQANMREALFEEGAENRERLFKNQLTFSEKTFSKYFYSARISVTPNSVYAYHVSCKDLRDPQLEQKETIYNSETYVFTATPFDDALMKLRLIFYGDLGLLNAQSVPRLTQEVLSGMPDLIIHNGDFAYDLDTERGNYGDKFMRLMEPIAARVPYQTSVGNHEVAQNFSHYDRRFTMINQGPINSGEANNFYYSFNAGPVHFVAISTEFYYFLDYSGLTPLVAQYEWLEKDLAAANSPSERAKRPWIVVFGHRPMYCSSRDHDDCSKDSNLLRRGLPFTGAYALEKLFYNYGVDVELYSHEHQYERFLPIFDGEVYNGTDKPGQPYHNAKAPVHLISGSAGCQEKLDPFQGHPVPGSVKQISDYGYTRITATRCSLRFRQVSDDNEGKWVDGFTLSKDRQSFPDGKSDIVYEGC